MHLSKGPRVATLLIVRLYTNVFDVLWYALVFAATRHLASDGDGEDDDGGADSAEANSRKHFTHIPIDGLRRLESHLREIFTLLTLNESIVLDGIFSLGIKVCRRQSCGSRRRVLFFRRRFFVSSVRRVASEFGFSLLLRLFVETFDVFLRAEKLFNLFRNGQVVGLLTWDVFAADDGLKAGVVGGERLVGETLADAAFVSTTREGSNFTEFIRIARHEQVLFGSHVNVGPLREVRFILVLGRLQRGVARPAVTHDGVALAQVLATLSFVRAPLPIERSEQLGALERILNQLFDEIGRQEHEVSEHSPTRSLLHGKLDIDVERRVVEDSVLGGGERDRHVHMISRNLRCVDELASLTRLTSLDARERIDKTKRRGSAVHRRPRFALGVCPLNIPGVGGIVKPVAIVLVRTRIMF
jgi:hypothetical protein